MINARFPLFIMLFILMSSAFTAPVVDRCTNPNLSLEKPLFLFPDEQPFKHLKNRVLSRLYTPFHMVQDEIASPYTPIRIKAKFDYDWLLHKDLEDERIIAYLFTSGSYEWQRLGGFQTNEHGEITVLFPRGLSEGDYLLRLVVEGDQSYADGYISVVSPGHQAIVFDIDGTLTLSDAELLGDYLKIRAAKPYDYANYLLQTYRDKGYELIFLTARPYWMASVSREWLLDTVSQTDWPLKTRNKEDILDTARYKATYLLNLIRQQHLTIVRAYGNAKTDIEAYQMAGIPLSQIYIIGPNAGKNGTQGIYDDSYQTHYYNVAINTPDAHCVHTR